MITIIRNLYARVTDQFRNLPAEYDRTVDANMHWQMGTDRYVPEEFAAFNQQADFLRAHPGVGLLIEGHCDSSETATREQAIILGEQRARAHKSVLHYQCGIELERLMIVSYGSERPVMNPTHNAVERQVNARTHTQLR